MRAALTPLRIVLIDDHEVVRNGLKHSLEDDPEFRVVGEADDGPRGVAVVETTRPDIVLLDVRLPTIDGPEVCRLLRERVPTARILILSAFGDDDLVYQCLVNGAGGYVLKDIMHLDLKKSLRAVARGESVLDPRVAGAVIERLKHPTTQSSHGLPPHQVSVLRLMSQGFSNREIAERLYLSENTVKGYVQEILRRLNARNRLEAVMIASRQGWL
jgi:two-component system, NarL family, response regulator DevR